MNDYGYLVVDFTKKKHAANVRASGDIKNSTHKMFVPVAAHHDLKRSKVSNSNSKESSKSLFKHGDSKSKKFLKAILSPKNNSKGFNNVHAQIFT